MKEKRNNAHVFPNARWSFEPNNDDGLMPLRPFFLGVFKCVCRFFPPLSPWIQIQSKMATCDCIYQMTLTSRAWRKRMLQTYQRPSVLFITWTVWLTRPYRHRRLPPPTLAQPCQPVRRRPHFPTWKAVRLIPVLRRWDTRLPLQLVIIAKRWRAQPLMMQILWSIPTCLAMLTPGIKNSLPGLY